MALNNIENVFDQIITMKSGGGLSRVTINKLDKLAMELRLLRTFIKYNHTLSPDSLVKISKKSPLLVKMLPSVFGGGNIDDSERLVPQFMEFIESNTSSRFNYCELNDSYLSEYMDYLDENLNDVLSFLDTPSPFLGNEAQTLQENRFLKQVKAIQRKTRFLRYLYVTEINGYVDREKLQVLESRIHFMADNVGRLCFSLWYANEDDTNDIFSNPPYLLCLIRLVELEMQKIFLHELRASKFSRSRTFENLKLPKGFSCHLHRLLMYLRNEKPKNLPDNIAARNVDVAIEFLLLFLADVPNRVINGKGFNEILEKVGTIAGDLLFITKNDTIEINLGSMQILEKTEILKAQVKRYYKSLKFTPSQFPTVGGLSFVDSFIRKLNVMLVSESGLDLMLKPHIGTLEKELSSLTSVFKNVTKVHYEHETLKDLERQFINLAYEAEIAIDSILVQCDALWHLFCSLPTIINEIKHMTVEVNEMKAKKFALKPCTVVEPSERLQEQHNDPMNDEEIVGFENDSRKIMHCLIQGTNELDVIPIVGMGGQGKTTLARNLYNNDRIVSRFDVRAWCCISQTYNRRELLQEIFCQVTDSKDNVDHKVDELADMLRKRLMGKRYLVVLDDMWEVMAWDDLRLSFPGVKNGSRILVTTRLEKVGKLVVRHTEPYSLPFLQLEESCKLLQKKVFQKEDFPPELRCVSLAVAERCKGLPLVIILVAGIVKRKKMEESWWLEVKNSLLSYLGDSEEYSLSTMQLSYDNLPDHLCPFLLYMGMFPEDYKIPVSKLVSLWIAEGFVQNIGPGKSEEAAEGYLMDLICSNLVMASGRRYNGKVKYCQVHDVVLHFCLEKSREEKFMRAVKGDYCHFEPFKWKESRLSFNSNYELSKIALVDTKTRKANHQHLRSLIMTRGRGFLKWNFFALSSKVRLLKVLDLRSLQLDYLSSVTLHPLIHLKYLSVGTRLFDFRPESHLLHLETLLVNTGLTKVVLPAVFWKMEKLRHVEFNASFCSKNHKQCIFDESFKLKNLRILRKVECPINDADSMDMLLQRCPNIQELEIAISKEKGSATTSSPKLESLNQLQVLHLSIYDAIILSEFHLPLNLKKLALNGPHTLSAASLVAGLPNLEYLQLADGMYESEEWLLGDVTFQKLKFLKLLCPTMSSWDASEETFPQLETLVLKMCEKLEGIPHSFADIQTLKQIKLIRCGNRSLEASAVKIREEVEDIQGSDRINIIITGLFEYLRQL